MRTQELPRGSRGKYRGAAWAQKGEASKKSSPPTNSFELVPVSGFIFSYEKRQKEPSNATDRPHGKGGVLDLRTVILGFLKFPEQSHMASGQR